MRAERHKLTVSTEMLQGWWREQAQRMFGDANALIGLGGLSNRDHEDGVAEPSMIWTMRRSVRETGAAFPNPVWVPFRLGTVFSRELQAR